MARIDEVKRSNFKRLDVSIPKTTEALPTRPSVFQYEVAMGKRTNATTWNKFGYNSDVDTGSPEVISSWGGAFSFFTSAETLNITSTSANDTLLGSGARKVIIVGINGSHQSITEEVDLTGTSTASTDNEFLGVNAFYVSSSGSNTTNEGVITLSGGSPLVTLGQIEIGESVSNSAIFYTQSGYKVLADWLIVNVGRASTAASAKIVTIKGWVYNYDTNTKSLIYRKVLDTSVNTFAELSPTQPFLVTEKSILYFTAESTVNDAIVDLRFSLIELENG